MRTWRLQTDTTSIPVGHDFLLPFAVAYHFASDEDDYRVALARDKSGKMIALTRRRRLHHPSFEDLYLKCAAALAMGATFTVEIDL